VFEGIHRSAPAAGKCQQRQRRISKLTATLPVYADTGNRLPRASRQFILERASRASPSSSPAHGLLKKRLGDRKVSLMLHCGEFFVRIDRAGADGS
jgi:hypothetical protein